MDVGDLFGAFEGAETVHHVHDARGDSDVAVGKRKVVDVGAGGGKPQKRQAGSSNDSGPTSPDNKIADRRSVADAGVGEAFALKKGEESSTVRDDGTLVKSVRLMHSVGATAKREQPQRSAIFILDTIACRLAPIPPTCSCSTSLMP